jgi:hypothetical protein
MRQALGFLLVAAALLNIRTAGAGDLVVVVNPNSGIEQLTRNQIIDIFLGRYRKLPSGAVAIPIDLRVGTPERKEFYTTSGGKGCRADELLLGTARVLGSSGTAVSGSGRTHGARSRGHESQCNRIPGPDDSRQPGEGGT